MLLCQLCKRIQRKCLSCRKLHLFLHDRKRKRKCFFSHVRADGKTSFQHISGFHSRKIYIKRQLRFNPGKFSRLTCHACIRRIQKPPDPFLLFIFYCKTAEKLFSWFHHRTNLITGKKKIWSLIFIYSIHQLFYSSLHAFSISLCESHT